jgi:alanine dehydrogenase
MKENKEIKLGANVVDGKITYKGVSEAFDLPYTKIDEFI